MLDYKKLIMERKSVREFKDQELDTATIEKLQGFFSDCACLSDEIKTEMKIVSSRGRDIRKKLGDAAGYNGFMIDAPHFLLILSEAEPFYIENAGYMGQDFILKAQSIGVDSCWVTIRDFERVKDGFLVDSQLEVVGLIALGYGNTVNVNQNKITDHELRKGLEEIIYKGTWGEKITFDEIENSGLLEAFQAAQFAPSALNRQPCRYIIDQGAVILLVQNDAYNTTYELKIAAGVAMMNFAAILNTTLFQCKWIPSIIGRDYKIPPDSTMIAYCNI